MIHQVNQLFLLSLKTVVMIIVCQLMIYVVKFIFDTKLIKKSLEVLSNLSNSITTIILILCVDDNKVFIKDPDNEDLCYLVDIYN